MADLAERVDDLICSFDSAGETTMDTLSMLIFGWMLFGLVVLCVGKYVYNRFVLNDLAIAAATSSPQLPKDSHVHLAESTVLAATAVGKLVDKPKSTSPSSSSSSLVRAGTGGAGGTVSASGTTSGAAGGGSGGGGGGGSGGGVGTGAVAGVRAPSPGGYVPPTPPIRKRLTRKTSGALVSPSRSSKALHLPTATGADAEAVRWVNELIVWLHYDLVILNELLATWVVSLNDFTANSTNEVRSVSRSCSRLIFISLSSTRALTSAKNDQDFFNFISPSLEILNSRCEKFMIHDNNKKFCYI